MEKLKIKLQKILKCKMEKFKNGKITKKKDTRIEKWYFGAKIQIYLIWKMF